MKRLLPVMTALCLIGSTLIHPMTCFATEVSDTTSDQSTAAGDTASEQISDAETAVPETEEPAGPVILPTDVLSTEEIVLYSSAACVLDADTGDILYYKNMDDAHYPASTTKVLTSLIALESLSLDTVITYTNECWDGVNFYTDTSIGALNGEELSLEDSVYAMMLVSANEVCNQLALTISGSREAFAELMNQRASELGCTHSHFTNPNGLHDEQHFTTAHDLAIIGRAAIQNEAFRRITGTQQYTVETTNMRPEGFIISNSHQMLMYTDNYYEACIGGKTGYTPQAANTLVTFANKDDHTLVCVVLENSDGHIYADTIMALDYCFDNYETLAANALPTGPITPPEAETVQEEPESIILQDPDISEGETTLDDFGIQELLFQLFHRIADWIMINPAVKIPCIIAGFALATLILIWLKRNISRMYHRHRYKKLRNKRINKK